MDRVNVETPASFDIQYYVNGKEYHLKLLKEHTKIIVETTFLSSDYIKETKDLLENVFANEIKITPQEK